MTYITRRDASSRGCRRSREVRCEADPPHPRIDAALAPSKEDIDD